MRADDLVNDYLGRVPGGTEAYSGDAQYALQLKWLRKVLQVLDLAMEDEGIPEATRVRVLRVPLYGTAEPPEDARVRIEAVQQAVARFKEAPVKLNLCQISETGR